MVVSGCGLSAKASANHPRPSSLDGRNRYATRHFIPTSSGSRYIQQLASVQTTRRDCKCRCRKALPPVAVFIDEEKRRAVLPIPGICIRVERSDLLSAQPFCEDCDVVFDQTRRLLSALQNGRPEV